MNPPSLRTRRNWTGAALFLFPLSTVFRFCDALIQIRKEIKDIEDGNIDRYHGVPISQYHWLIFRLLSG